MKLKNVITILFTIIALWTNANASIVISHDEGSATIDKFDLKIISINNKVCFEQDNISEFTPRIIINSQDLENCDPNSQYRIYGLIKGWLYGHKTYYSDFVSKNANCRLTHEKDGYVGTKLVIDCGEDLKN